MFCVLFCFLPVSCAALRVNNNNMKTRQFPTLAFSTFPDKALFSKPLRSLLRLLVAVPISGYSPSTRRAGFGRDPAMSAYSGLGALGWIDMPVNAITTAIMKQPMNQPSRRALAPLRPIQRPTLCTTRPRHSGFISACGIRDEKSRISVKSCQIQS